MRVLAACLFAIACGTAYGHGIGSEVLPPQDAGGKSVSVEITGVPTDEQYQREFTFRTLDAASAEPVPRITYQIKAEKSGNVLLDGTFEAPSGTLVFEMQDGPEQGAESGGGLFGFLGDRRVRVTGPHFGSGGLYQFDVQLLSVGSQLDDPPYWRGGVSLVDIQDVRMDTGFGEQRVRHMSYYDTVENIGYQDGRIKFSMPFDGTPQTIAQTSTVHEEIRVSKEFGSLMVSEISAEVNGEPMPSSTVQIDDFVEGYRTIHIVLGRDVLEELYEAEKLGSRLDFSVGPASENLPFSTVTRNGQYRIIADAEPGPAGLDISYKIEDVFIKDRAVAAAHRAYAESDGQRFFERDGVSRGDGGYDSFSVEVPAGAQLIYVGFEMIGGSTLAEARLPVLVESESIPGWVKNTAQLWSDNLISDAEFAAAMGYLVSIGVISADIPGEAGAGGEIPGWIKGNAQLWSDGLISDGEFTAGIEYLMSAGIVRT